MWNDAGISENMLEKYENYVLMFNLLIYLPLYLAVLKLDNLMCD